MVTERDYYEILGVPKKASESEIKKAYRQQALKHHPDRDKSKDAEKRFKEINEAYEVLADSQKRALYDRYGHAAFAPGSAGAGPFGGGQAWQEGPFSYTYYGPGDFAGGGFGGFSDPFEIFEAFFGGASPFRRGPRIPTYELELEFMEAVKGVEKEVDLQGEKKTIKIPAGVRDGSRVRFGDFNVVVRIRTHPEFQRDGYDIWISREIGIPEAVLGTQLKVPTIEGDKKLKIPPGIQSGTVVRMRGRGIPHVRGSGKGDQYVRILVAIPKKPSQEEKKLYQKLQELKTD